MNTYIITVNFSFNGSDHQNLKWEFNDCDYLEALRLYYAKLEELEAGALKAKWANLRLVNRPCNLVIFEATF